MLSWLLFLSSCRFTLANIAKADSPLLPFLFPTTPNQGICGQQSELSEVQTWSWYSLPKTTQLFWITYYKVLQVISKTKLFKKCMCFGLRRLQFSLVSGWYVGSQSCKFPQECLSHSQAEDHTWSPAPWEGRSLFVAGSCLSFPVHLLAGRLWPSYPSVWASAASVQMGIMIPILQHCSKYSAIQFIIPTETLLIITPRYCTQILTIPGKQGHVVPVIWGDIFKASLPGSSMEHFYFYHPSYVPLLLC